MRIGIITFQRSFNYGAFLQCYALARAVASLGHNVEVVDYQPDHRTNRLRLRIQGRRLFFHRANFIRIIQLLKVRSAIVSSIPLSRQRFDRLAQLRSGTDHLDAIICGSDQIWNAAHTGGTFDPAYFGRFGRNEIPRISYAASLGTNRIELAHRATFKEYASILSAISLREETGRLAAEEILERECSQMPDPTFLIEDWTSFGTRQIASPPYLLSYRLEPSQFYDSTLQKIARSTGLPVIHIADQWPRPPGPIKSVIPSPREWLSLIAGATHFVTNSFHGAALAIRFHRSLTCIALQGSGKARMTRITELMSSLDLNRLVCSTESEIDDAISVSCNIDWNRVESLVAQERNRGFRFISQALSAENPKTPAYAL